MYAAAMRFSIRHETLYRYSMPVEGGLYANGVTATLDHRVEIVAA